MQCFLKGMETWTVPVEMIGGAMKELEYPFDGAFIIANRKKIRKKLLGSGIDFLNKRIAILGASTTKSIVDILDLFLLQNGIKGEYYESEYGRYYEESVFPNERLNTTSRNVDHYPSLSNSEDEVDLLMEAEKEKLKACWEGISQQYRCPIIQNNFEMP